jgi:hypothetical protein
VRAQAAAAFLVGMIAAADVPPGLPPERETPRHRLERRARQLDLRHALMHARADALLYRDHGHDRSVAARYREQRRQAKARSRALGHGR